MKKKLRIGMMFLLFFLCIFFGSSILPKKAVKKIPFLNLQISSATLDPASAEALLPTETPAPTPTPTPVETPTPEPEPSTQGSYDYTMMCGIGALTYYNQGDPRWAGEIFGGSDTLAGYGCGPTALAMLVNSFTNTRITPPEMAQWAADNGYWFPRGGSIHSLIPEGAAAFGLQAESFQDFTEEGVRQALSDGKVLVALMGHGHFTQTGHFIIIASYYSGSQVTIADPSSIENTLIPWDINLILEERNSRASNGGPIWAISLQS